MIDRHRQLVKEREDLQTSSQDASRLMARGQKGEKRDPGKLLREEKMRKRIAKELPKIEAELSKTLENWENEYGRPFLVHGERYLDELYAAASKPAPPRSKTPSVAPQAPKSVPKSAPPSRGGSVRNAPPTASRAKTPTAHSFAMSVSRNPLASSISQAGASGNKSPSRIPARAPLKTMPHGNNSPERQPLQEREESTIRKMGPPRAPPPKMKDLFMPPPTPSATPNNPYSYNPDRSASIIRQVQPEDVYDDRAYTANHQMVRSQYSGHQYPSHAPPSRQISATSSASAASSVSSSAVPRSENWETCSQAEESDEDTQDYYGNARAAYAKKRFTPEGGYASPRGGLGKKLKGNRAPVTMMESEGGQLVRVEGSEAGWTDEDGY
jgi:protein regulator of cytokinesis 1